MEPRTTHHSQSDSTAWPEQAPGEQSKLQENIEQATGGHIEEERRGNTYSMPRRYHCGMARQCPCGHSGIKPGEVADNMSAYHLTRHTLDLSMEKAKQLKIKLEVAMAEIQSFGGEGDESVWGATDKISRTGRSAIA
jgi:hypothetical protein